MDTGPSILLFAALALVAVLAAVAGAAMTLRRQATEKGKLSRIGLAVSILPSIVLLVMFYSLAWHMYRTLGKWPATIGERGFPPHLLVHAHATTTYFGALFLTNLLAWPIVFLVCALVPPWRGLIAYLSLYLVAFVGSVCLLLLAPKPFLRWWWD